MKKTLLLCFIHGFKGDDNTFGNFPEHLRAIVSHGLPKVEVKAIVYPKFETRGDLAECVSRFRDWLLEKVIDIEVANATPSPTVDPSVHTILIGHSMGGIVAADTLLALTADQPIESSSSPTPSQDPRIASSQPLKDAQHINAFMFPYIHGVLAFDTPYLGISPGVVAHGAEGHYNTASEALSALSGLTGGFWGSKAATDVAASTDKEATKKKETSKEPVAALPAPPSPSTPVPAWQRWGKIAAIAGAGAAVAAGGSLAYLKREQITEGWSWVGSHLEFVGCLMRAEDLRKRVAGVMCLNKELGTGWANLYTRLGKRAVSKETGSMVGSVIGNQRTFCNLPKKEGGGREYWREAINDAATDEVLAHMNMFIPKENPGFYALSEEAKGLIMEWMQGEWYETSEGKGTYVIDNEL